MRASRIALALALLAACSGPRDTTTSAPAPLAYVELLTGGAAADDTLPLIVALHGRGDTADGFARAFRDMPLPARVALLRAPIPEHDGDAWFTFQRTRTWEHVADDLETLSDRVVATTDAIEAAHPSRGRPILTGFSQGAMIAYAMALRHPERFGALDPVSGALSTELLARHRPEPAQVPPIVAFHGTRDEIIPIDADRDAADVLGRHGIHVEVRPHDATHWLDGEMRADLWRTIEDQARP